MRQSFGVWPMYSPALRRDMDRLLARGGSLSGYRSSPDWPTGPRPGSWAARLERVTEQTFGIPHVAACSSGTMALLAALWALDLPLGAEVITTPYTFSATAAAIHWAGCRPVFADVDPITCCLDPASVGEAVGIVTRAILPVDLFGQLADYRAFRSFRFPILEDACQAVGATGHDETGTGGTFGQIGVYSFNGAKNVPAGEAGAVVTPDETLAERARAFLSHGENWGGAVVGQNGRLAEPLALIAYHGVKTVRKRNAERQRLARVLIEGLGGVPGIASLPDPTGHSLYVFALILERSVDRGRIATRLRRMGVEVGEGYTRPLHLLPAFGTYRRVPLPVVERLWKASLLLFTQVRPPATATDMQWLAEAIRAAIAGTQAPKRKRIGTTPLEDV